MKKYTMYTLALVTVLVFILSFVGWVKLMYFPCNNCVYIQDPVVAYDMQPWLLRVPGSVTFLIISILLFIVGRKK